MADANRIKELLQVLQSNASDIEEIKSALATGEELYADLTDNSEEMSHLSYYLGLGYLQQKKPTEALDCFQRSLKINRDIFTDEHPYTAAAYGNLADAYMETGAFQDAEFNYQKAVEIASNTLGDVAPLTVIGFFKLATVESLLGARGRAIGYFTKVMVALEDSPEAVPDMLAETYISLGQIFQEAGEAEYMRAKDFYEKAYEIYATKIQDSQEICAYLKQKIAECNEVTHCHIGESGLE